MSIWQHVLSARNQAHHTDLASQQELICWPAVWLKHLF